MVRSRLVGRGPCLEVTLTLPLVLVLFWPDLEEMVRMCDLDLGRVWKNAANSEKDTETAEMSVLVREDPTPPAPDRHFDTPEKRKTAKNAGNIGIIDQPRPDPSDYTYKIRGF